MMYRRILYLGQFAAAVVLPTWVLVTRGLLDDGIGWEFLVYIIACPFLAIAMLAVGGLIAARQSVRAVRAVSWTDAGLLTLWYLAILSYGLWAWPLFAAVVVVLTVAVLWASGWQLFRETRERFRGMMAGFEQAAQAPAATPEQDRPRVIVINPSTRDSDPTA